MNEGKSIITYIMNDLKKWEKGKKSISRNGIMTYIIVALRYDKERTIFHSFSNHEDRQGEPAELSTKGRHRLD